MTGFHMQSVSFELPHLQHHLEVLAHVIVNQFLDDPRARASVQAIQAVIGYMPQPLSPSQRALVDFEKVASVIGWYHPNRLEHLIHREWIDAPTNEFTPQLEFLRELSHVQASQSIDILGAGVCRLAQALTEVAAPLTIRCQDLSFLALDLGQLLLRSQSDALPRSVREPLRTLDVQDGDFIWHERPPAFLPGLTPETRARTTLSFAVSDACHRPTLRTSADLVCLPFLLDALPQASAVLAQIARTLLVGQRLLVMTTLARQRDPAQLVAVLRACGWTIDVLRVKRWSYSLSRHDWTFAQETNGVVLIAATRAQDTSASPLEVAPTCMPQRMVETSNATLLPGLRHRGQSFGANETRVWARALAARRWTDFEDIVQQELGEQAGQALIAWALARGFLTVRDTATRLQ